MQCMAAHLIDGSDRSMYEVPPHLMLMMMMPIMQSRHIGVPAIFVSPPRRLTPCLRSLGWTQ